MLGKMVKSMLEYLNSHFVRFYAYTSQNRVQLSRILTKLKEGRDSKKLNVKVSRQKEAQTDNTVSGNLKETSVFSCTHFFVMT